MLTGTEKVKNCRIEGEAGGCSETRKWEPPLGLPKSSLGSLKNCHSPGRLLPQARLFSFAWIPLASQASQFDNCQASKPHLAPQLKPRCLACLLISSDKLQFLAASRTDQHCESRESVGGPYYPGTRAPESVTAAPPPTIDSGQVSCAWDGSHWRDRSGLSFR